MKVPDRMMLRQLILDKYRSLEEPNRHFIVHTYNEGIYAGLVQQLSKRFSVEDRTDLNYGVAFDYWLLRAEREWFLEISMVGPYALLRRRVGGSASGPLTADMVTDDDERFIVEVLERFNVRLLDQATLEEPIDLHCDNAEPGHTHMYHALIYDELRLPWPTPHNDWLEELRASRGPLPEQVTPPAPPSRQEVLEVLTDLATGRRSRDEAANWAVNRILEAHGSIADVVISDAIGRLSEANMVTADGTPRHREEEFWIWQEEVAARTKDDK